MKRFFSQILLVLLGLLYVGCESYETYSDKKEQERDAINAFLSKEGIRVINDAEFKAKGNTTDVSKNEFVYFDRTGVYMQIVRQGSGNKLEENKTVNITCRFMEKNIKTDSILIRNDQNSYITMGGVTYKVSDYLDKMTVTRSGTTITASFVTGMMYMYHGSATVPAGWLVPLNYINIGRPDPATAVDEETAKVRLIVPHSQGTADASASVFPCYYEISYERTR